MCVRGGEEREGEEREGEEREGEERGGSPTAHVNLKKCRLL